MTTWYIVLKVSALLTFIVLPLVGPKKKKKKMVSAAAEISDWAIDANGDLEAYVKHTQTDHHPVK